MLPCLTPGIIRYRSRIKWSNPGKGVTLSPTFWCCSSWKGSLWIAFDYSCQLYFIHIYIYIYIYIHTLTQKVCSKSNETKSVFIKTEMNNEWNISFLENTSLAFLFYQVFHWPKHLWNSPFETLKSCVIIFLLVSSTTFSNLTICWVIFTYKH